MMGFTRLTGCDDNGFSSHHPFPLVTALQFCFEKPPFPNRYSRRDDRPNMGVPSHLAKDERGTHRGNGALVSHSVCAAACPSRSTQMLCPAGPTTQAPRDPVSPQFASTVFPWIPLLPFPPHPPKSSKTTKDRKPCLILLPAHVCLETAASLGVNRESL